MLVWQRRHDAACEEIAIAVVVDGDGFRGFAGGALEADVARVRGLDASMASAQAFFAPRIARRALRLCIRHGTGCRLLARELACGKGRRLRDGSGLFPLAVERDADHADVVGAPGARGV